MRIKTVLITIILTIIISFLVYHLLPGQHPLNTPRVQEGFIDLSQWDFEREGLVRLDGQWEFYWSQLLPSGQHTNPSGYMQVPGLWWGSLNGTKLQPMGFATYRLIVKVKPMDQDRVFGLKATNIKMASAIYVNGKLVEHSGQPAARKELYTPENRPYTAYFSAQGDIIEILIQEANYDFAAGGIVGSLYFGNSTDISEVATQSAGLDYVVITALMMLGLYHIGAFLARRRDTSLFYFGMYCMGAALSFASLGERVFIQLFPWVPFESLYKLLGLATSFSLIMLSLFIRKMCKGIVPEWFIKTTLLVYGMYFSAVLLLPQRIYSYLNYPQAILMVVTYLVVILLLSGAFLKGRYGGFSKQELGMLILAFTSLDISIADNTLYNMSLKPNNHLSNECVILFSVLISLMLTFRFAEAFETVENLSNRLLSLDKLKDEFLTNISHELQTPLNGMINMVQATLEGTAGAVTIKQRQILSIVVAMAKKFSGLINDMLDLSKIKRNEIALLFSEVDVGVVSAMVIDVCRYSVDNGKLLLIQTISEQLPCVKADENRLRQVLFNLIGNSIKFTQAGKIEVGAVLQGDTLKITVEDTGIGIPPNKHEEIFQSFEQTDQLIQQRYGGTGLGLYISRKLIDLMGGKIYVEWSEPGRGTRIAVVLPISREQTDRHFYQIRSEPEPLAQSMVIYKKPELIKNGSFRLLAVDDQVTNLQALVSIFHQEDYDILTATDGKDAMEIIRDKKIDLVLLDVVMPDISGLELCRVIRTNYALFDLPVLLITVRNTSEDIVAGLEAGANDYLIKPFDAEEVRARVKNILILKKSVRDALRAEMSFLQSQIKPHFLYNALNSISTLCLIDGEKASALIDQLGIYLHGSYDISETEVELPLKKELELVRAYLKIEKARFGSKLMVEFDIEPGIHCRLMPLIIQPLVENAVRHGLMKKNEGGWVKIGVYRAAQDVCVVVEDNGVGLPEELLTGFPRGRHSLNGVGLINIHRRLQVAYGRGLTLELRQGGGSKVSFTIPWGKDGWRG
jgi:signal transduction histidine kinase